MLFPEEETVSSVVEKGNFYTPVPHTKDDNVPKLRKAALLVIPGGILSAILPLLLPELTLTHFLVSLLPVVGFFILLYEDRWFNLGFALSLIQLLYGIWRFASANLLPLLQLFGPLLSCITILAFKVQLGVLVCFWIGMIKCKKHKSAGPQ